MKTNNLLFALLCLLIICSACDDSDDQPAKNKIPLVKTETWFTNGQQWGPAITYEYDRQGRITKRTTGDIITSYAYEPGKVFVKTYYIDNKETHDDTILLNDKGLQMTSEDFTLKYNADGYLIEELDFRAEPPSVLTLTILNGNTVKSTPKNWNQYYMATTTYKFNESMNTIGNENKGIAWCGKQDKNLVSESLEVMKVNGLDYEWLTNYTYELDTKNRVTKRIRKDERGESYFLYTYY